MGRIGPSWSAVSMISAICVYPQAVASLLQPVDKEVSLLMQPIKVGPPQSTWVSGPRLEVLVGFDHL